MRYIDPVRIRMEYRETEADDDGPELELVEEYAEPGARAVRELHAFYGMLLEDDEAVDVEETEGRTILRASTADLPREKALAVAALSCAGTIEMAGGHEQIAATFGADDIRGYE